MNVPVTVTPFIRTRNSHTKSHLPWTDADLTAGQNGFGWCGQIVRDTEVIDRERTDVSDRCLRCDDEARRRQDAAAPSTLVPDEGVLTAELVVALRDELAALIKGECDLHQKTEKDLPHTNVAFLNGARRLVERAEQIAGVSHVHITAADARSTPTIYHGQG